MKKAININKEIIDENRNLILNEIKLSLEMLEEKEINDLINAILAAKKVFVVGVGRVLLMLQAFAKRLNHLDIETYYVGMLNEPAITSNDLLIVGSGSGESIIPVTIATKAKQFDAKIAYIGTNMNSTVANLANYKLRIPCSTKLKLQEEVHSQQIMSSLFEQSLLLTCDLISLLLVKEKNLDLDALWQNHANLE